MTEQPLYQDEQLKIDYNTGSIEDHIIYLKEKGGEELGYLLPRGILQELARTSRGGIEQKLDNFNTNISFAIKEEGIGIDGLHVALCQAFSEENSRMEAYIKNNK